MPRLNKLICSVAQADGDGHIFDEYGVQYRDSEVDCLIRVPERDPASTLKYGPRFTIQLQSEGFIAPGLAMFVRESQGNVPFLLLNGYILTLADIDGQYACNRNRRNLRFPEPGESPSVAEVNFKVRQIERFTKEGQLWGQSWAFKELSETERLSWTDNTKQGFKTRGIIEVIVLRCHPDKSRSNPLSAFMAPQPTTLKLNPTKGSWTYVQHDSLFDGRLDNPENLKLPFGCDGGGDDPKPESRDHKRITSRPQTERKVSLFGPDSAWKKEFVRSKSKVSSRQDKQDQITIRRAAAEDSGSNAESSKKRRSSKGHAVSSVADKKETVSLKSGSADKFRVRNPSSVSHASKQSRSHKSVKKQDGGMNSDEVDRLWEASPQFGLGPLENANETDLRNWSILEAKHRPQSYIPFLDLNETESPRMTDTQFSQAKFDPGHEFDKKLSHVVVREDSTKYAHTLARPSYIDSMDAPYARFVFRYRDKATIEILLGITIVDKPDPVAVSKDATDPLSEFDTMSKEDLIEKLLAERKRIVELQVNKEPDQTDVKAADPSKPPSGSEKQPRIVPPGPFDNHPPTWFPMGDQAKASAEQQQQLQNEYQKRAVAAKDPTSNTPPKDDTQKLGQESLTTKDHGQWNTKGDKSPRSPSKTKHAKSDSEALSESSDAVIARFAPAPGENLDDLPLFDPASVGLKPSSAISPLVQEPALAGSSASCTGPNKQDGKKGKGKGKGKGRSQKPHENSKNGETAAGSKQKGSAWNNQAENNWSNKDERSPESSWNQGNASGWDNPPAQDNWSSKNEAPQASSWGSDGNDWQRDSGPPKGENFLPGTPSKTTTYWDKSTSPGGRGAPQGSSAQAEKQSSSFRGPPPAAMTQHNDSAFPGSPSKVAPPYSPSKGRGNTNWQSYGALSPKSGGPRGRSQNPPAASQRRAPSHSSNVTAIHAPAGGGGGGGDPGFGAGSGPQSQSHYSSAHHQHAAPPNPSTSFSGSVNNRSFSQKPSGSAYHQGSSPHPSSNRQRNSSGQNPAQHGHHGHAGIQHSHEPSPNTAWGVSPNLNPNPNQGSFNTSFHTAAGGSFGNTYDNSGNNNSGGGWGGNSGNGSGDSHHSNSNNDNNNYNWGAGNTDNWGGGNNNGNDNNNWGGGNGNGNNTNSWGNNNNDTTTTNWGAAEPANTSTSHDSNGSHGSRAEPISESEVEDLWNAAGEQNQHQNQYTSGGYGHETSVTPPGAWGGGGEEW